MGFATLTLQCNASGTPFTTTKAAPRGFLVGASVYQDSDSFPLESNWASVHIGVEEATNTARQLCLTRGYLSSLQPLTWTGRIKLDGSELLMLLSRSTASSLHRAVFTIEEAA